jgi:Cu/Ag efflux protein CusF
MKRAFLVFAVIAALASCEKREQEAMTSAIDRARDAAGSAVSMGEQTYPLEGRIVSRDVARKQVTVDHKEIPGLMAAMTMPFDVRGDLNALPPDGTEITATVHAKGDLYWLSDIRPR